MDEAKRKLQIEKATKFITSIGTGEVEPWDGNKGPMVSYFLKNKGQTAGPKGHKTQADFVRALLVSLKGTGFYIRFNFNLPDGSGGMKNAHGTLISVSKDNNLTFACRDRIKASFTTEVDKVELNADVEDLIPSDEVAEEIDLEV